MEGGSVISCIECNNEPGDVYSLRIQRLGGGSFTVSMLFCEQCADEFLNCDWIEDEKRETVKI